MTLQFYSLFIFGTLQEMGNVILSYREAEASLNNFKTILSEPIEAKQIKPEKINNLETFTFEHVSFKHKSASHKAINNISFDAKIGETVAFVGPSGSGKSTLMKLLVGLYRPLEGKIMYNNLDETEILFETGDCVVWKSIPPRNDICTVEK